MATNNAGSENHSSLPVPTLHPLHQPSASPDTVAEVKLSLDPLEVHTLSRHFNLAGELTAGSCLLWVPGLGTISFAWMMWLNTFQSGERWLGMCTGLCVCAQAHGLCVCVCACMCRCVCSYGLIAVGV